MENRIINLSVETPLLAEWEKMDYQRVTINGFKPLSLLPNLTEVSGVIVKVKRAYEFDDGSVFLNDIDITLLDRESHSTYTIRVRTKERMGGPDWDLLYYAAELHSVANEDLPYWADSFEEKAQIEMENNTFPLNL